MRPSTMSSRAHSLLALAFALCCMLAACSTSHDLSEAERRVLLTECDFVELDLPADARPTGEFTKTEDYANRSTELAYELLDEKRGIYVNATLAVERNPGNVLVSEFASRGGLQIGLSSQGIEERPIPLTQRYGKRASLGLLIMEGKPVGNHFDVVDGNKFMTVLFTGVYFDNEQDFAAFIAPKLALLRDYQEH